MGARLLLHLPLAMAVLIGPMIVLTTAGWVRGWWVDAARAQYLALSTAGAVVVAQLADWRLIGWGLT